MKKIFATAIIAALCGTVANAQEILKETKDTVYVSNPADIEYSQGMLSSKYNYRKVVEEKGLRRWKVEGYVGNDTEPATFWSANREGLALEAFGMVYDFDGHTIPGIGGGVTYLRKWLGLYANGAMCFNADEARTSDRYGEKFTQFQAAGGFLSPALETKVRFSQNASPSILSFRLGLGITFKKCKDFKYDKSTSVTTEETETEYIITTTKTTGDLDARPHVWGWEALARVQLDFGGSPLYLFGTASYGKSQNFTYSEAQWHNAFRGQIGIGFRIFNGHSYNKENLRRAGYTEREVKRWNW